MIDPDHREMLERVGAAHANRQGLQLEAIANEVRASSTWYGPVRPRCPAPPMTAEMLALADSAARMLLQAQVGELIRVQDGHTYIYRRKESGPAVVV